MTSATEDESVRVLHEGDAVELLVYLVTTARTQVDEAAEYAPMRLLTAAGRLAEMVEPNASARLRPLLRDIRQGFSVVTRPSLLRAVRMVSPGMLQRPMAAIVICVLGPITAAGRRPGLPPRELLLADVGQALA
jgi:Family of unknown function (DUF6092)